MKRFDTSPEALAEELLGRRFDELDEDEQGVLRRVMSHEVSLDHDEIIARHATFGDRLADRVAAVGGSWAFIGSFGLVMVAWMLLNGPLAFVLGGKWDAYPYILLNLALSTLAALQAPVILMSQNRQAHKDRISSRHDYEVNLRTTVEILLLHRKLDRVLNQIKHSSHEPEPVKPAQHKR